MLILILNDNLNKLTVTSSVNLVNLTTKDITEVKRKILLHFNCLKLYFSITNP